MYEDLYMRCGDAKELSLFRDTRIWAMCYASGAIEHVAMTCTQMHDNRHAVDTLGSDIMVRYIMSALAKMQ